MTTDEAQTIEIPTTSLRAARLAVAAAGGKITATRVTPGAAGYTTATIAPRVAASSTRSGTYHPAISQLPDNHGRAYHGAFHSISPGVTIGPVLGSQEDRATHCAVVDLGSFRVTFADPDRLDELGRILRSAAHALRQRQLDAGHCGHDACHQRRECAYL